MHVRWRGLELPASVRVDEDSRTDKYARMIVEPFERGFGSTVGNSLRRILLSSIEGAAVTSLRIAGVDHEFSTIPGVLEDVTDIILNIKGLLVSLDGDGSRTMKLAADGPGEVTAELIVADTAVRVHNTDHIIATLTEAVDIEMEMIVKNGRGYVPASEQYAAKDEQVIGEIPIDAVFSPVQRVRYRIENTRVGQRTNYDRLVIDIWTDGSISPEMSLVEAAKILRKHLNPFVQEFEMGAECVSEEASVAAALDAELIRKLDMSINEFNLTVRSANCIEAANIKTVAELVQKEEHDLLAVRSFGKTSMREVKRKLEDLGLSLGMELPDGYHVPSVPDEIEALLEPDTEQEEALVVDVEQDVVLDDEPESRMESPLA